MSEKKPQRIDHQGNYRKLFESCKKRIFATQNVCGICGGNVDFSLKFPHPMSACIDHIVPIARGGNPIDIDNMQLAHMTCNRKKSDKLQTKEFESVAKTVSNRVLPQTLDWQSI